MIKGWSRALRFDRSWRRGAGKLLETEVDIPTPSGTVPGTLVQPQKVKRPLPGWVILHGITRPGRAHPTLLRFVRALAGSGAVVLLPEISHWRALELGPDEAATILKASLLHLAGMKETADGRLGAMGFSFGAPQVLMAGADPELVPHLRVVTAFGGYAVLERTLNFLFRGEHEWEGTRYQVEPDPYGRWVAVGNFLTRAPKFQDHQDVADALIRLAQAAGDAQLPSWEAHFDGLIESLEGEIHPQRQAFFRELALPSGGKTSEALAHRLVPELTQVAHQVSPLFDIIPRLPEIRVPVRLIHGRQDRLMPFTETLRLAHHFPREAPVRVYLTGLFSHSQQDPIHRRLDEWGEKARFLAMMAEILGLV